MSLTIENILLIGSFLLLVSIIAGKTTYRFGVPTLILFLTIGMIAGADGIWYIFRRPQNCTVYRNSITQFYSFFRRS